MFAPRPRVSHAVMVKKRSNEDIEAAIAAAFSQLGYPVVKAEQLEAARGVKVSAFSGAINPAVAKLAWATGLQGFRGSTVAILKAHLGQRLGASIVAIINCTNYTDCRTPVFHTYFALLITTPNKP